MPRPRVPTVLDEDDGCAGDEPGNICHHGLRDDQECMSCIADGCSGGGDCSCPANASRSRRHLYAPQY